MTYETMTTQLSGRITKLSWCIYIYIYIIFKHIFISCGIMYIGKLGLFNNIIKRFGLVKGYTENVTYTITTN